MFLFIQIPQVIKLRVQMLQITSLMQISLEQMDGDIRYTMKVTTTGISYNNSSKIFVVLGKL